MLGHFGLLKRNIVFIVKIYYKIKSRNRVVKSLQRVVAKLFLHQFIAIAYLLHCNYVTFALQKESYWLATEPYWSLKGLLLQLKTGIVEYHSLHTTVRHSH